MKKHANLFLFFLLLFIYMPKVNALDSFCWNPTTGELNSQLTTDSYGCGPNTCVDDDGINPYCVNKSLGGTIYFYSSYSGSYGMGEFSSANGFYAQQGYSDVKFNFNIPVWRETIMNSITISSKGNDGTTQWYDGMVPMSYDYCSDANIIQNTGNFNGMYFDGYDRLPIDNIEVPNANGYCYRVYVRMKVRIMYLLPNQINAVPIVQSSYYYMSSFDNVFSQFYNNFGFDVMIAVNNLQYYTQNQYYSILDDIDYRNYLYNVQDMQQSYLESQNKYIQEIKDSILSSEIDDTKANGFFSNFNTSDNGGISSIISAPLRFINRLDDTCQAYNLNVLGTNVNLPCGTTLFWDKPEVQSFRNTWNILVGAPIIYALLLKLFKVIESLKDVDNSKVEVLDL